MRGFIAGAVFASIATTAWHAVAYDRGPIRIKDFTGIATDLDQFMISGGKTPSGGFKMLRVDDDGYVICSTKGEAR